MDAIILAAGKGSRLGPDAGSRPKSLIDLGGVSPLLWTLSILRKHRFQRIIIVVGYQASEIKTAISRQYALGDFTFVENVEFSTTDTARSFAIAARESTDGVLLTYGDTLVAEELLARILAMDAPNSIAVDRTRPKNLIDMKVKSVGNRVLDLGKDISCDEADGESACLYRFDRNSASVLCNEEQHTPGRTYFEGILRRQLQRLELRCVDCTDRDWVEIDYPRDVDCARDFLRSHGGWKRD